MKRLVLVVALLSPMPVWAEAQNDFILSWNAKPMATRSEGPAGSVVALRARRAKAPPRIDGKLDDACWKGAAEATKFSRYGRKSLASQQTSAFVSFDDQNIYAGYRCQENEIDGMVAKRLDPTGLDADVWYNDCVELFLDPQFGREQSRCYQFEVDSLGQKYDGLCYSCVPYLRPLDLTLLKIETDASWNSHFQAAAVRGKDHWTVELAVPLRSMGVEKILDGSVWGANFTRNRPRRETSTWLPGLHSFGDARHFRKLILGEAPYELGEVTFGECCYGRNRASIHVKNNQDKKAALQVNVEVIGSSGNRTESSRAVAPGPLKEEVVSAEYDVPDREGEATVIVSLRERGDGKTLAKRRYSFEIPTPILACVLNQESLFLEQKELAVSLKVNLGAVSLKTVKVELELLRDKKRVRYGEIKGGLSWVNDVRLNMSSLDGGAYRLSVRFLDGKGNVLAETGKEISKVKGPFD